jgi:hypothetical protein
VATSATRLEPRRSARASDLDALTAGQRANSILPRSACGVAGATGNCAAGGSSA